MELKFSRGREVIRHVKCCIVLLRRIKLVRDLGYKVSGVEGMNANFRWPEKNLTQRVT